MSAWITLRPRRVAPPLQVSLWYWHQPFRVPPGDAKLLRQMNVKTLFVRAATLVRDRETGHLHSAIEQTWASRADGFNVQLVFNADYSIVRSLGTVSDDALATAFREAIRHERARAEKAGITVRGVQLDFDVPTRQLGRYARLLRALRADPNVIRRGDPFSITALPTWLTSPDIREVADAVDFIAPQFYEAEIPQTLEKFATISSESRLKRGLQRAGSLGIPFWAGLPAYGHALVYDGSGHLRGTFHDSGVLDMLHQPYFRLIRAYPAAVHGTVAANAEQFIGENIVELGPSGVGVRDLTNFHLVFDLPTATLVLRQLALVRENRPANCAGVILYRYPEAYPTAAVALTSIASAMRGVSPHPHLKIVVYNRLYAPWRGIEGGGDVEGPSQNVFVNVTNDGDGQAGVGPNAVDVGVVFNRSHILEALPAGFDVERPFAGVPGAGSSLARANGIRFTGMHLAPGQMLIAGPIRVAADTAVASVHWKTTSDGALTTFTGGIDLLRTKSDVSAHP